MDIMPNFNIWTSRILYTKMVKNKTKHKYFVTLSSTNSFQRTATWIKFWRIKRTKENQYVATWSFKNNLALKDFLALNGGESEV